MLSQTIELPLELIELETQNFHLLVASKLSDGTTAYWIVDTGASKTVFDSKLEEYYKPEEIDNNEEYRSAGISVGIIETRVGQINKLCFGKVKIKNLKVALIDLSHITEIYKQYADHRIVGLLGSDVLKCYGCKIDYQEEKISFRKKPTIPFKRAVTKQRHKAKTDKSTDIKKLF